MNGPSAYRWNQASREAEKSIDLSRFPLKLQVKVFPGLYDVEIAVRMVVNERDAPQEKMVVGTRDTVSHDALDSMALYFMDSGRAKTGEEAMKQAVVEHALRLVRSIVLHELDECTLVDGERIYDPHIPERRRHDAHP